LSKNKNQARGWVLLAGLDFLFLYLSMLYL